ncbi:pyridoxal-phosphate-dependent aminotransferase family protein [Litoreibacter roseus]|uniref:Septum site-determining protein n=1 Tax=Litoreibacter roseus TaxID=2601869 RepID=A0A6N6JE34_9RHOB|nr:aminotransferase class V-fold PLP-dependent enzyme [Litoreibacter roseus]GFE63462.1 septum site-determining protein [Litoreibacter roseus]
MSLAHGRHTLAIPGPSVMPDRVLQAMHRAAPNIYTGELIDMTHGLVPDLKAVAKTDGHVAMYIGNGHAAWEAALANVLAPGDKVLVPATGQFSHGWAEMATKLGIEVEIIDFGKRDVVNPARVEEALTADKAHAFKAVLLVQTDTSTSAKSDLAAIRRAIDAADHPALMMVDSIACLGCDDMQMDAWGVDILVAGCQKGLMTPPGMAFVFFNDKADAARDRMTRVSGYWDWKPRANPSFYYQMHCGTAPTHHLYGLRVALDMILKEEGLDQVLKRHATLASAVWTAFETWGQDGPIELNITDRAKRSNAVTSIRIGAPYGTQLRDWLTDQAGVTLGIGLGMAPSDDPAWHGFFRVGHMGHLNTHMLMGTLGSIEAGLTALQIPHGKGALAAAAEVCAAG